MVKFRCYGCGKEFLRNAGERCIICEEFYCDTCIERMEQADRPEYFVCAKCFDPRPIHTAKEVLEKAAGETKKDQAAT